MYIFLIGLVEGLQQVATRCGRFRVQTRCGFRGSISCQSTVDGAAALLLRATLTDWGINATRKYSLRFSRTYTFSGRLVLLRPLTIFVAITPGNRRSHPWRLRAVRR